MRVTHDDCRANNFLLDESRRTESGFPTLTPIDLNRCRGFKGTPLLAAALPMLRALLQNLREAAGHHDAPDAVMPTRADKLRLFKAMADAWPTVPDGLHRLPRHPDLH